MGGYLQDYSATGSFDDIDGYGWVERDCEEVLVRAMCRLDCDSARGVKACPLENR